MYSFLSRVPPFEVKKNALRLVLNYVKYISNCVINCHAKLRKDCLSRSNIKWTKSVEHPLLYPFNFCSTVFFLDFIEDAFGLNGHSRIQSFCSAIFVPLFLFHNFCSAIFVLLTLFALALGVPVTQWPTVPTNFCSTIFVPLTFLHLHLGSPSPNGRESPPIFVPQFLFHNFCSADLFALALGVPVT